MKRSALRRTAPPRPSQAERLERQLWIDGMDPACAMREQSQCVGRVCGHHCITRQTCRKHRLSEWSQANRLGLCERHHRRHHNRREPVLLSLLPGSVVEFAWEADLLWMLKRDYA